MSNSTALGKPVVESKTRTIPLPTGRPRSGLAYEPGDLDREEPRALKVRDLHVDLGTGVRDVEVDDAREDRLAPRQTDERVPHHG